MRSILTRRRGRAAAAAAVTVAALIGVIPPAGAAQAAETPAELVIPAEMTADPSAGLLPMAGSTGFVQGPTNGRYDWVSYAGDARTPLSGAGGRFRSVGPARLLDTRSGLGAPRAKVGAAKTVTLQVAGRGGLPAPASRR